MLVDGLQLGEAVRNPNDPAHEVTQIFFGALQAQTFVPPQIFGVQADGGVGKGDPQQAQQKKTRPPLWSQKQLEKSSFSG